MSGPLTEKIRGLLDGSDGHTTLELAGMLGIDKRLVAASIAPMHGKLVYVDRWQSAGTNGQLARVWVNVQVPADCPRPDKQI